MRLAEDVIINMLRTEKGSGLMAQNKYLFKVETKANKIEIKNAVQKLYKVEVDSVNIISVKGKKKRVRYQQGYTSGWKKAVVTLKPNNQIEVV